MSRLAEIYKSEKAKGGGIASALGKRALEKIDPRRMFNQKGLAAAIAPSLFKTYSATRTTGKSPTSLSAPAPQISTMQLESKIDGLTNETRNVSLNTQLAAKNSMTLPDIARDMNVMRQNIVKLVKLQGGEATNKADMYFRKSSERESAYETQFSKQKSVSPTPATTREPDKKSGILGFLSTLLAPLLTIGGTIVSAITGALAPLLTIGGTIVSAITGALGGLGELILGGLKNILTVENLMKSLGIAKEALMGIVRIATLVATNPVFLAIAGIASAAAILAYMRGNYDAEKERYLELAKKKKETGSLSVEEEAELKRINRPNFQQESRKQLGGYDPITNKIEAVTSVEGITKTNQMNDTQLRNLATEQLANEGKSNATLKDIEERFVKLKKERETAPRYNPGADSQSANTTTPSKIPDIPGSSKETLKTPTIEKFDYKKYKELVGKREGDGKYDTDNTYGFLGKYQFGGLALETFGYLKPGTGADKKSVYNPSNWTGKNGMNSADDFKKASDIQENLMNAYTDMNLKGLQKSGVLTGEDSGSSIAAKLYAAHHGGVGGASKFFNENKDTTDFAFAGASVGKSAALMATAYQTGKIGGAEYSGLGGTSVASSATPTGSAGMVGSTGSSTGNILTTASVEVASAGQAGGTTIINNNTTNNSKTGGGGQGTQGTPNIPSVFDDVFTALFGRVT